MQVKNLQLKRALHTVLFVLLNAVGMGKMYAYDFSAVCATGQTLYYTITNASNHYVALVAPGGNNSSGWNGYTKPTGDIVLPESVQYGGVTYTVTSIGNYAFRGCSGLTGNLNIPNSVTLIATSAFSACSGLTSLTIPNSVTSIATSAFSACSGLTNLTIPNSVISIGNSAFEGCTGLTSLTIPNSVISIGINAFRGCTGLTSLTIPNSVTSIGNEAFRSCSGLEQIIVDEDNPSYDSRENCNALIITSTNKLITGCKNTIIPNSVTSIGDHAFYECSGLTSLTIPNSVTSIGWNAFYECSGLKSLTIGNSVISIDNSAFEGCTGLTSLTIPNSVTLIGDEAFMGCTGLTSLTIGNSVTTIGGSAFSSCRGLTSLTIPNSVISVGQYAFYQCSGLTSLTLGNSVTSIGQFAFYSCSGLTSLTIPNSVTSIGPSAFLATGWSNNQPNGVLYLSNCCLGYKGQQPIGALNILEGTRLICNNAFYGCSGLTGSLNIPDSVTSIGYQAFRGCSGLTSLTIGNSVTFIGEYAFQGCSGVTEIFFNATNCADVYNYYLPFQGCGGTLVIGENVERIPAFMFQYFSGLASLTIGNSVTSIGKYAFRGCSRLTSLTIPNSVTSIGDYAFTGCSGLSTITVLAETPPTLGNGVFQNLDTSLPVYVPCGFDEVYASLLWGGFGNFMGLCAGEITVTVNPAEGGTVAGTGYYEGGTICTLTATPNEGYLFLNWSKNGEVVSTDSTYSFIVAGDADLAANFAEEGDMCFITFDLYDSYGDGYTGNYLVVTDENGSHQLTVESGSSVVYTLPFLTGSHITLTWIVGSYPEDCSFTVSYEDGPAIYEGTNLNSSFFYEFDVDCNTSYTISKPIVGYGEGTGNWYLIASPVSQTLSPDEVANMINTENADYYDLYKFDQNEAGAEWQNYKAQQNDFSIVNGQGYLYANKNDVTLSFVGTPPATSSLSVDLDYTENKPFAGWNLIGNPFNDEATLSLPFYRMAPGGEALEPTTETGIIAPMEGVFVKATDSGQTAVFTIEDNNRLTIPCLYIGVLCNRGEVVNKAIVRFDNGRALEKFSFGEQSGTIYIPQDGKDYVVASTGEVGEIPVSFKAETNGSYTLSFTNEEVSFSYLRLIDNMTGIETDLLETPYYTFNATTTDYTSRFRLVFAIGSSIDGDSFGYINGNGNLSIFGIEGEATLQVVDILGHVLSSETFSGSYEKKLDVAPGVYMLRLINGDDMKTQKIVIK